jgi:hypothetical protein
MYRKDRTRPTVVREYMEEIYREPFEKRGSNGPYVIKGPWQTHPRRFSRHKVVIQTARMALGYTGIYDEDESDRILESRNQGQNVQRSITFDANQSQAAPGIAAPQPQPQIMQDLAEADFDEANESVPVQYEQEAEFTQEPFEEVPPNAVFNTEHGEVSAADKNMIDQMIGFTVETKSWKTTADSFKERYSGSTLGYALDELALAQQKASEK